MQIVLVSFTTLLLLVKLQIPVECLEIVKYDLEIDKYDLETPKSELWNFSTQFHFSCKDLPATPRCVTA